MVFPESQNSAMWVDIAVRKDTIRVFNNHLQTSQIDENDRKFLRTEPLSDTLRIDKAKGIARKLKRNFMKRAEQADSVALRIHGMLAAIRVRRFYRYADVHTLVAERGGFRRVQRKGRGLCLPAADRRTTDRLPTRRFRKR